MNITFACPDCHNAARLTVEPTASQLVCPHCQRRIATPEGAWQDGVLARCLVCPSTDLFVRKDFPQRLGVGLVALGILGSSITWYYTLVYWTFGILFATALIDVLLYVLVGDSLMCYRCHAEYRQVEGLERHGAFNLETHERHRQIAARTASRTPAAAKPSNGV